MSKKSTSAALPSSFEEAMAELEQLVARMEAGELPLEASVAAYKRGFRAGQVLRRATRKSRQSGQGTGRRHA